jgi:SAM-dependent methyltransferase
MNYSSNLRQHAPATLRNRQPILDILLQTLPATGSVLEISSGTGEHAAFFAPHLYPRKWIPSDPNPIARTSIAAWRNGCSTDNLLPPIAIDACDLIWPVEQQPLPEPLQEFDLQQEPIRAIVNINMIHIVPWAACLGLMAGAGRILPDGGVLYLYGPYKQGDQHTAPSNVEFDRSLRQQNPEWGVRNLEDVIAAAQTNGLIWAKTYPMPANNLSVVFIKNALQN